MTYLFNVIDTTISAGLTSHTSFPWSSICERITPRLAHANAAIVLSAVKCLMKFMELMVGESEFVKNLTKKLAPPLVTLLSSEPEVSHHLQGYTMTD